jgi:hypothetical protein
VYWEEDKRWYNGTVRAYKRIFSSSETPVRFQYASMSSNVSTASRDMVFRKKRR